MSERLSLRIDNRLPELDRLRSEVECFLERCAVGGRAAFHIQLALDELVTNVICYAYETQGGHTIDVSLICCPRSVEMTVQDEGKPFNPFMVPDPDESIPPEQRKIGGLGVHFVRKTMDHLGYERKNGKNIIYISKNIC